MQIWYVSGSVSGARAPYLLDMDVPAPYSDGGLQFSIDAGGIPFAKGDKFSFTLTGGHWRWRKDGGGWSALQNITTVPALIDSGLSLNFAPGAAPAFFATDLYSFKALQPNAVSNIISPDFTRWRWTGSAATLYIDLGSVKDLDAFAMSFHTLPASATITLQGGATPSANDWTGVTVNLHEEVAGALFSERTARYLKLSMTNATGAGVGFVWVGKSLQTECSAEFRLDRDYRVNRDTAGVNGAANYLGVSTGGEFLWSEGALNESDALELRAMVDASKARGDYPIICWPQATRVNEPVIATIVEDRFSLEDVWKFQPKAGNNRRFAAKLPLAGVVTR